MPESLQPGNQEDRLLTESYLQYDEFFRALIRREQSKYTEDGRDFHREVLDSLELDKAETLVDVGCGNGHDLLKLATVHGHRGRLIGYEIPIGSFEDRFYAAWDIMQRSGIYNISFRKGYAQDLDEPDSSIDVLLAFNLLYEIPNPEQALSEFYRVTKPGGKLAFITNAEGNRSRTHYYLGRIGEYLGVQAPAPRSSRFNYAKAKIVIPRYFKVIKENEQDSTRLLSVDDVITGLDTYFPLFGVETKGYLEAREKVRREIEEDARVNSGNITEIVKLGSFICINEKAA